MLLKISSMETHFNFVQSVSQLGSSNSHCIELSDTVAEKQNFEPIMRHIKITTESEYQTYALSPK